VRALLVVVGPPRFCLFNGIFQGQEPVLVQGLDGSGFRGTTTVAALCQNPQGHRVIPQQRGSVGPADQEASRQR
jgi:hypothetical protein